MAASPRNIGRYQVLRLLGQGGMGRVWLARDTVLGRRVAIKVLRDDLALPPTIRDELVVRMGHEAQAAAAVSHPNIVTLYDMGEDDTVGLFLVFEYVVPTVEDLGPDAPNVDTPLSLRDRLKRGPLPLPTVAKLANEIGSALAFAHEAGVIHRDVKPENILFSRTGFKIADFGIARVPDSTITRADTILGTPAYTSPEALSTGTFSSASDQFSFAATLYESATGTRAFAAEDAIATAGKVSSEPPPPLHDSLGPDRIVRALDAALQRGLAKSADARFGSCAELGQEVVRAIENVAAGRATSLTTPEPAIIEFERTPLSSRGQRSLFEPNATPSPSGETQFPSIYVRRRTHRFQNIAAGIAVLVIIVLVLMGRRTPTTDAQSPATSSSTPARPQAKSKRPTAIPAIPPVDAAPTASTFLPVDE